MRVRASNVLVVLERALTGKEYLVGTEFSGADVMMGYFLMAARTFGVVGAEPPNLAAYWERLAARPGFQRALSA
jgi:glutathione S-transferase